MSTAARTNSASKFAVVYTHNGHIVSTHREGHVARARCEKEARALSKWINHPSGANRNAIVGVEVREVA